MKTDTKWKAMVRRWLGMWEGGIEFTLPEIYSYSAGWYKQRHRKNRHVKEKIRQSLQELCAEGDHILERVSRGVYRIPLPPGHPSLHAAKPAAPPLREALVRAAINRCVNEVLAINNKS